MVALLSRGTLVAFLELGNELRLAGICGVASPKSNLSESMLAVRF
jgi:hypothetical protein